MNKLARLSEASCLIFADNLKFMGASNHEGLAKDVRNAFVCAGERDILPDKSENHLLTSASEALILFGEKGDSHDSSLKVIERLKNATRKVG